MIDWSNLSLDERAVLISALNDYKERMQERLQKLSSLDQMNGILVAGYHQRVANDLLRKIY